MRWRLGKSLKPGNQETKKPKNNKPKPKNKEPRNLKPVYFQVRESPAPLNIPTPTPAPWSLRPRKPTFFF